MKKITSILVTLVFLLNFVVFPGLAVAKPDSTTVVQADEIVYQVTYDSDLQGPVKGRQNLLVKGKIGRIRNSSDAKTFLSGKKALMGISDTNASFKILKQKTDKVGMTHYRAQQLYKDIPVYGKEIIVHTDRTGTVESINGDTADTLSIDINPKISQSDAIGIARNAVNAPSDNLLNHLPTGKQFRDKAELSIYDNHLAYLVEMKFLAKTPGNWKVFVDAVSGEVLEKFNQAEGLFRRDTGTGTGYFGDVRNLEIIWANGYYELIQKTSPDETTLSRDTIWTWDYDVLMNTDNNPFYPDLDKNFNASNQKIGVDAHYYSRVVYDYFKTHYGRNSFDGAGTYVDIFSNDTDDPLNASSLGEGMMFFGSGDHVNYAPFSSSLDVVAHEYTHEIISAEGVLAYRGQSGALNESFADIFACVIDPDWQLGEDIVTPGIPGGMIRDISNPQLYGQPAHMDDFVTAPINEDHDWGEVHLNSGIPSKAFYNIATQIGTETAAQIYYHALTNYFTSTTNFAGAKNTIILAAQSLYPTHPEYVSAIRQGWASVGIGLTGLSLNKSTVNLTIGIPEDLIATASFDDGSAVNVTNSHAVTWKSSSSSVVSVSGGRLTPLKRGTAKITVTYQGKSATAMVTVIPVVDNVQVNKTSLSLLTGGAPAAIKATAYFNDGTRADVTKTAEWTSSDTEVATVSAGRVSAVAKGSATVTVRFQDKSATVPVTVSVPVSSLVADNTSLNMIVGQAVYVTVYANFTDSSIRDVTDLATWKSANSRVATVAAGRITPVARGKTTITAEYLKKKVSIKVEVTPVLDRLEANQLSVSAIVKGAKAKIKLTAYYNDGSRGDVTKLATWTSADSSIASVQKGIISSVSRGNTNITATYMDQSVTIQVMVTPKFSSITASSTSLNLVAGGDVASVILTANYNDGLTENVTAVAAWQSSNSNIATVQNGVITPLVQGKVTITAQYNQKRVTIRVNVAAPPV